MTNMINIYPIMINMVNMVNIYPFMIKVTTMINIYPIANMKAHLTQLPA